MSEVLRWLESHVDEMVDDLREFVDRETPTIDKASLDAFASFLARYGERMTGGTPRIVRQADAGDHVVFEMGDRQRRPRLLMVGHFDTVWPLGTLAEMPFSVAEGVARGPGAFDMKAGLVQGFWALRALRELHGSLPPMAFLCNSDEETGSLSSQSMIENLAREAGTALVMEPSQDGRLKTARKGVGIFQMEVVGRPAHAGADPFRGASAIEELARQVLDLHAQTSRESGTTVNVGVVSGGTRSNVIAERARAEIDLRVVTGAEADRMTRLILGLTPHNPEVTVSMSGGMNRPPMERTERTAELFALARRIAQNLGFEVGETLTGGGSDGNFCAAAGAAVLDGLGAVGDGAHARHEHVLVGEMPRRAAMVAHLIAELAS